MADEEHGSAQGAGDAPIMRAPVDAPVGDVDAPPVDVDVPAADVDAPAADVDPPAADVDGPAADADAPAADANAPAADANAPAADVNAPPEDVDAPAADGDAPAADADAPPAEVEAPAVVEGPQVVPEAGDAPAPRGMEVPQGRRRYRFVSRVTKVHTYNDYDTLQEILNTRSLYVYRKHRDLDLLFKPEPLSKIPIPLFKS